MLSNPATLLPVALTPSRSLSLEYKKYAIVGDYWSTLDAQNATDFAELSGAGQVIRGLLAGAGIAEEDCFFTNVFRFQPPGDSLFSSFVTKPNGIEGYGPLEPGKYIPSSFAPELTRLHAELAAVNPVVTILLGNLPLWAVCRMSGIKKHRGTPMPSYLTGAKVIPTWHPLMILKNWKQRPIAAADIDKVRRQSEFREVRRPQREVFYAPSLNDIQNYYWKYLEPAPFLSTDIETKMGQITEIGFSPSPDRAIVIPFYSREQEDGNYWRTLSEERMAWRWVRKIMKIKEHIGQNFLYDMQYLWRTAGIPSNAVGDTMLLHHTLQPEMEKGLGFLGSIYTDEPSWKFMRADHDTLKKGDD